MKFFKLKENGTEIKNELLASITVFILIFSTILINAHLMETAGIAISTAIFSLILSSAIVCIIGSFITKLPLGLTIGIGLNSIAVYLLVDYGGLSWAGAMAIVFITSVIFLIITISPLFKYLINFIPTKIKLIFPIGIGFYLLYGCLRTSGFIIKSNSLLSLNNMFNITSIIILFGIFFTFFLFARKHKRSLLIGMVATIILSLILTIIGFNTHISLLSQNVMFHNSFDLSLFGVFLGGFSELTKYPITRIIIVVLSLLFIWFADVSATLIILKNYSTNQKENKIIKKPSKSDYLVVGLSSLIGSIFGVSFIIACSEQIAGPIEGGKTNLTTFFLGILLLLSLFFVPILTSLFNSFIIIGPILIISILLMKQLVYLDLKDFSQTAPLFMMILVSVISSSIGMGIIISVLTYFIIILANGEWKELKWYYLIIYLFFIVMLFEIGQIYYV